MSESPKLYVNTTLGIASLKGRANLKEAIEQSKEVTLFEIPSIYAPLHLSQIYGNGGYDPTYTTGLKVYPTGLARQYNTGEGRTLHAATMMWLFKPNTEDL